MIGEFAKDAGIPVILDGGLVRSQLPVWLELTPNHVELELQGTTLEDMFGVNTSHTPLWSANSIDTDPEVIVQAHLSFLRAGARVITTST